MWRVGRCRRDRLALGRSGGRGVRLGPVGVGDVAVLALLPPPFVPPQQALDPRQQLGEVERLGDVVVGAELEAVDHVVRLVARGEHQDRREVAVLAQPLADLEAVDLGQADVEQDEVVAPRLGRGQPGAAVAGDVDVVLLAVQVDAQALGEGFLVLDEQDARDGFARHEPDSARGSVTTNRVPGLPSMVIAFTSPFISLTSAATIARPRPVPPRRPEISRPIW